MDDLIRVYLMGYLDMSLFDPTPIKLYHTSKSIDRVESLSGQPDFDNNDFYIELSVSKLVKLKDDGNN